MDRKNANDLRKEYNNNLGQYLSTRSRIKARALLLVKQYPEVSMGAKSEDDDDLLTTKDYYDIIDLHESSNGAPDLDFVTNRYLKVIEVIEQHIASQQVHVQTTLYPKL